MEPDRHEEMTLVADAVVIDFATNAIRVRVPGFPGAPGMGQEAMLDVGSNGRLIGLEIGEGYVSVMDTPDAQDPYVRTADVLVDISADDPPFISIPRRGETYEITYPSGNECWQVKSVDGRFIQVCATIDDEPSALRGAHERRIGGIPRRR